MPGLAIVVSPLISLMKDQVDALRECGIPAACVNSSQSPSERQRVASAIRAGELKLLYVAPERLCSDKMLDFLSDVDVSFIAIDEAHCISAWGHDFRPEYRLLTVLHERFPSVPRIALTATADELTREEITEAVDRAVAELLDAAGKTLKSLPKAAGAKGKAELKELKADIDEAVGQLAKQAEKLKVCLNIENIFFNGYLMTPMEMNSFFFSLATVAIERLVLEVVPPISGVKTVLFSPKVP